MLRFSIRHAPSLCTVVIVTGVLGCTVPQGVDRARVGAQAPRTQWPGADRVIAVGDLHGDLSATRTLLRALGLIDERDRWSGGTVTLVQTGDILDRGDDELELLELLERLEREATAAGGTVVVLNGNHEVMNVELDFRYATLPASRAFVEAPAENVGREAAMQGRIRAFEPGGPWAVRLARRGVVAKVGDTLFAHGGITREHVRYGLEKINAEVSRWMQGEGEPGPLVTGRSAPIWVRSWCDGIEPGECEQIQATLDAAGARRMVLGHTTRTEGIHSACEQRVWCIDAGLSDYYGGRKQAIEIVGDQVRVISAD